MRRWLWLSIALLTCEGCEGETVVEASPDSSAGETGGDAALESSPPLDTGTEIDSTIAIDSAIDSTIDSAMDGALDSAMDSRMDSAIDTGIDSGIDSAMPVDSGADTVVVVDAVTDAGPTDPACGTHKGGPMVYSGAGAGFCIDQREVTRAEYALFLAAPTKPAQPPHCDWNMSFDPLPSAFGDDYPITGVDWCDALTYCKWADKHLCGDLATGAVTSEFTAATTQWSLACANGDGAAMSGWATGPTAPAAGVCHIDGPTAPAKVDAHPLCRGTKAPWDRVRGMVGNAAEWDGAGCYTMGFKADTTPAERMFIDCNVRGGGYLNDSISGQCFNGVSRPIDTREASLGLRCCKKI